MRFFFYGTLTPDLAPEEIAATVQRGRFLARGTVRGRLFAGDGYPEGIIDASSSSTISGKVFEFPEDETLLRELDEYEGFDPEHPDSGLFMRRLIPVDLPDGRTLPCWVYAYNREPSDSSPIHDGDYERWLATAGHATAIARP